MRSCKRSGPAWCIEGTRLSSVTINVNYESHYHYDAGDFLNGYSTLSVVEVGKYGGGFLVFPRYRIAVDVREGDVLTCQSHVDLHGNYPMQIDPATPVRAKRVSFVTYLKHKLGEAPNRLDAPDPVDDWTEGRQIRRRAQISTNA